MASEQAGVRSQHAVGTVGEALAWLGEELAQYCRESAALGVGWCAAKVTMANHARWVRQMKFDHQLERLLAGHGGAPASQ